MHNIFNVIIASFILSIPLPANAIVYTVTFASGHQIHFDPTVIGQTITTPDDNATLVDTSFAVGDSITPQSWTYAGKTVAWSTAENNRVITSSPQSDIFSLGFHEAYRIDNLWHLGFTSAPMTYDSQLVDVWDILNFHLVNGTEYTVHKDSLITFFKTHIVKLELDDSISFAPTPVPLPPTIFLLLTALPVLMCQRATARKHLVSA